MNSVPSSEIANRFELAKLAVLRGCRCAVEVGVDHGMFAKRFMDDFAGDGRFLILVDPFEPYDEMPWDRTPDMTTAILAMMPHHGNYRFVRKRSPECVPYVMLFGQVDFVLVDGAHTAEAASRDMEAWWSVLPDHGIMAVHDYSPHMPGVVKAVDWFCEKHQSQAYLTVDQPFPTAYMYKSKPERMLSIHGL